MGRILHHVGIKEFKKVHQRKLDEHRLLWQEEKKKYSNIQEIKKLSERFKSDWRTELAEAMSSKDFPYIYGGVVAVDILSLTNLPGSQFAQNSIQSGANQTDYAFGSEFPGSYVNSIGDIPNVVASAVDGWDSVNDLVPSGWTPENSDEYIDDISTVVSSGQETTEFKDTHFGEVHLGGGKITIHTGDDGETDGAESGDSTVDIEDLETLFPGITFPKSIAHHDDTAGEPYQASMLLRTFKDVRVGDKLSFNYSFDTLETEEDDDVNYRGNARPVPGDDTNEDDYAFVIVGDSMKGKIVSVLARDGNNIDFNFQANADGYYKPDVLQGRFPLTGNYQYTVTKDDIDDYGNVKFFIGVMDSGDTIYQSTLDITSLRNETRAAAGKLGKVTGGYDLGYRVEDPTDLLKLQKIQNLLKKIPIKNLEDKYGYKPTESDGWMEDYLKGGKTQDPIGDLLIMGLSLIVAKTLVATIGPAATATITRGAKLLDQFGKWWNKGKNVRIKNEDTADLGTLWADEMSQLTRSDAAFQAGKTGLDGWNPFKAFTPKMIKTGPSPAVRQSLRLFKPATSGGSQMQKESYDLLSEQVTSDDKFIEKMKMVLNKIKTDDELQSLIKFLNKASKAKEKFEQKTAGEGNSNALYQGQPSPNGFPDNPPAQLASNGYHPEFGKRANRYRTLDPISAKTMARVMTGDPETDSQVAAAARQPKVAPQKSTTWRRAKKHLRRA